MIGTPIANRGRAEIEGLIGFFVNTLVLRARPLRRRRRSASCCSGSRARRSTPTATRTCRSSGWSRRCSRRASLSAHAAVPGDVRLAERRRERAATLPGLTVGAGRARRRRHRQVRPDAQPRRGRRTHRRRRSSTPPTCSTPRRSSVMPGTSTALLEAHGGRRRAAASSELPLLDRGRAPAAAGGVERDRGATIRATNACMQLFEAQAARTPDAVAVVRRGRAADLRRAERRAPTGWPHHLRALGVGPEALVAICARALASSWSSACWRSSRPAAPTCRSIPTLPARAAGLHARGRAGSAGADARGLLAPEIARR